MVSLNNLDIAWRGQTYRYLGSFWNQVFGQPDKVKVLMDMNLHNSLKTGWRSMIENLAGNPVLGSQVAYVVVPFMRSDVAETGMLLFDDPDATFTYPESYDEAQPAYSQYRIRYFVLPLTNIIPVKIQALDRVLYQGVDFFIQANNWIFFRQDPREIFPSGNYCIIEGWDREYRSVVSYFTKTNAGTNDDLVVRWLREAQTPHNFKLALAAVARLGIVRSGGILRAVTHSFTDTIYTFDRETVRVSYRHVPLRPGTWCAAETIIGDVIQVFQAGDKPTAWWKQVEWQGGIILDPILPQFRGLPLRNVSTVVYPAGQELNSVGGSQVHARMVLGLNSWDEEAYWKWVGEQENRMGLYLNRFFQFQEDQDGGDATVNDTHAKLMAHTLEANALNRQLGWPEEQPDFRSLPQAYEANALDTFFQLYLNHAACVIAIDLSRLSARNEVMAFLRREVPVGSTNIILGYISDMPADPVNLVDNVKSSTVTPVTIRPLALLAISGATESVVLNRYVHDYATLGVAVPNFRGFGS